MLYWIWFIGFVVFSLALMKLAQMLELDPEWWTGPIFAATLLWPISLTLLIVLGLIDTFYRKE